MAAAALAAIALTACAPIHVGTYLARDMDFARYRSWDWGPADALPTGDPRLDNNAIFHDHFQGAMERSLASKGLVRANGSGEPDLLIHYHANVSWRSEIDALDRSLGYCITADCQPAVYTYEAGTFVVDVVDTRTKRMVWRGWAQDRFEGAFDTQERLERTIDEAVRELMKRFPAS